MLGERCEASPDQILSATKLGLGQFTKDQLQRILDWPTDTPILLDGGIRKEGPDGKTIY
jgi:hypothetical protein